MTRGPVSNGICRDEDKWYVVLREPDPATGKTRPVWHSGFRSKAEAEAFRDERKVDLRRGRAVKRTSMTVRAWLARWLPMHVETKRLAGSTFDQYTWAIKQINHVIGGTRLQDLTPLDVQGVYDTLRTRGGVSGRPLSNASIKPVGAVLKASMAQAVILRLIEDSPAEAVPVPTPDDTNATKVWSAGQLRVILKAVESHDFGALFLLQSTTGQRRGMLLGLRWADVDLDGGYVRFRTARVKGKEGRMIEKGPKADRWTYVKIDDQTMRTLKAHRAKQLGWRMRSRRWLDEDYVFTNHHGGPVDPNNLSRAWRALLKDLDVPYMRPHNLRHTHATALLEAGEAPHVVSERLGHKDVATTLGTYSHVTPKQVDQVASTFADWLAAED